MTGLLSWRGWPAWTLPAALLLWLLCAGSALGQTPLQITKLQDVDFGGCDNVGGATYSVTAAATQGVSACFGAHAAQFTIVGDPNRRARIQLASTNVTLTNGSETLTASLTKSVGNGPTCLGTGTITVYVGGSLTLPGGGLTTFGIFLVPTDISASYVGGSC